MSKLFKIILLILLALTMVACKKSDDSRFEVYLIKYNGEKYITDINEFELPEKALFTDKDIKAYKWSNHEIVFTETYLKSLDVDFTEIDTDRMLRDAAGGSVLFDTVQRDSFVVVCNGKKMYYGNFEQSVLSSYMNPSAIMLDTPSGVIISLSRVSEKVRDNNEIYNVLKKKKILSE